MLLCVSPFVIPMTPALDPTISMQKSGACPVMPNMVVLRYFSCPARSIKVTTFEAVLQMWTQSREPACDTHTHTHDYSLCGEHEASMCSFCYQLQG